ncbi:MarR family transcriptional regulator [Brachybacterium sp. P6-10-X1]|nr:MarR family transcriptional regulator [Brachybacterium sp. P6-10-X1]
MDALWDSGELTVREVITALGDVHAYTTIATVLTHLGRKGMIRSRRQGRSVRYAARRSRSEHAARVMEHALSASRDRRASIVHFVETMDPGEVDLLRSYLDQHPASGGRDDG